MNTGHQKQKQIMVPRFSFFKIKELTNNSFDKSTNVTGKIHVRFPNIDILIRCTFRIIKDICNGSTRFLVCTKIKKYVIKHI